MEQKHEFQIGELVVLKTDPENSLRIVVTIGLRAEGTMYEVALMDETSWHAGFELMSADE